MKTLLFSIFGNPDQSHTRLLLSHLVKSFFLFPCSCLTYIQKPKFRKRTVVCSDSTSPPVLQDATDSSTEWGVEGRKDNRKKGKMWIFSQLCLNIALGHWMPSLSLKKPKGWLVFLVRNSCGFFEGYSPWPRPDFQTLSNALWVIPRHLFLLVQLLPLVSRLACETYCVAFLSCPSPPSTPTLKLRWGHASCPAIRSHQGQPLSISGTHSQCAGHT